jgi:transposase
VTRAQIILLACEGKSNSDIARELNISRPTVIDWRERFEQGGPMVLTEIKEGRGRKPSISAAKIKEIIDATIQDKPSNATHWSCRTLAEAKGVSKSTVQRIWDSQGLKPHRVTTFKISQDKQFVEKLTDVVGLYMNPPDKAIVLCVDEKIRFKL